MLFGQLGLIKFADELELFQIGTRIRCQRVKCQTTFFGQKIYAEVVTLKAANIGVGLPCLSRINQVNIVISKTR